MRIDVLFGPGNVVGAHVQGRVVAVIDVLRASTSIAAALANGARTVIPFERIDDVIIRAKQFERGEVRLAGERKMQPIPGFDLGNSPGAFTEEAIRGKTVLMTTTNGTAALHAVQGARDVVVAAYVNFSAVCALLRTAARGETDVVLVCAGHEGQFALEDASCAGRYASAVLDGLSCVELGDGAAACVVLDQQYGDHLDRLFADSEHGRALQDAGFAADLECCAAVDAYPVIPVYRDRQLTKLGPERER
ncbi:MAG TPA: 2-phosphosulfolactate phosphatase [Gemmatimonadaceae bacterium]|nr:2-phosphosulfolactate phosphatase [Gemmatimonadaceae bacterium]